MVDDLKRLEDMLVDVATKCHNSIKSEIVLQPEDMDFGSNVDDAYQTGINNGRADLAKEVLKALNL